MTLLRLYRRVLTDMSVFALLALLFLNLLTLTIAGRIEALPVVVFGPFGLAPIIYAVTWRYTNRGLVRARRQFRAAVRRLDGPPAVYVNRAARKAFFHAAFGNRLLRWHLLTRVAKSEMEGMYRSWKRDGFATGVFDEFEAPPLFTDEVRMRLDGVRVMTGQDGQRTFETPEPSGGLWRRIRVLADGQLSASEADLVEVCEQLASAKRVMPEDPDGGLAHT